MRLLICIFAVTLLSGCYRKIGAELDYLRLHHFKVGEIYCRKYFDTLHLIKLEYSQRISTKTQMVPIYTDCPCLTIDKMGFRHEHYTDEKKWIITEK